MRMLVTAVLVVVVGVVAAVLLTGGSGNAAQEEVPDLMEGRAEDRGQPTGEVTIEQILRDPRAYAGAEVVVRGVSVVPLEPEGGFLIESDGRRLLVYAPDGVKGIDAGDEGVAIRGEVARFTEPAAEALGPELANAENLASAPTAIGDPYLLFRAAPVAGAGEPDTRLDPQQTARLAEIAASPRPFYGDAVTLAGTVVRREDRSFVLEAEGERLLVVPQSPDLASVAVGDKVRAQGLVEQVEPTTDSGALGADSIYDEFEGEPSLSATRVAPLG